MSNNLVVKITADVAEIKSKLGAVESSLRQIGTEGKRSGASVAEGMTRARGGVQSISQQLAAAKTQLIAFFGVSQMRSFASDVIDAGLAADSLHRTFQAITGSSSAADKELADLRAEAERTGQNFYELAPAVKGVFAAAKGTSSEGAVVKDVLSGIAEAATALSLKSVETERALGQLSQMISKNKLELEDLKTFAESFPGAMDLFARGFGKPLSVMLDMMSKGQVLMDDVMPGLARELHDTYRTAAETSAMESGRAAVNRLSQSWTDFKTNLFDTGAFVTATNALNAFILAANRRITGPSGKEILQQKLNDANYQLTQLETNPDARVWNAKGGWDADKSDAIRTARAQVSGLRAALDELQRPTVDGWMTQRDGLDAANARMEAFIGKAASANAELTKLTQTPLEKLNAKLAEMTQAGADPSLMAKYREQELAKIAKKNARGSAGKSLDLDDYGTSALTAMQNSGRRELDILQAKLTEESAIAQAAYDADQRHLEQYYDTRLRVTLEKSAAEIQAQRDIIAQAQTEITRVQALHPSGTRGAEQISDQVRTLNEKIADAETRITVLQTEARTSVAQIAAEHTRAKLEYISAAMQDAQSIISSTEQSMQSRIVAGLETEATARERIRLITAAQAQTLQRDLVPAIQAAISAATNPAKRAELEAMLSQIAELQEEGRKKGWTEGLIQGVKDYATSASDAFETAQSASEQAMQAMEDAMVSFVTTGKMEFSDMVDSIIADLARIVIQQNITQPLASGLSSVLGGLFGGGSSTLTGSSSTIAFSGVSSAKGNVFDSGLSKWSNSVVSSPTYFNASGYRPFAMGGVFGEAGPEAVMPLTRTAGGELGVKASGSGGTVVNVYNNANGTQATTSERQENGVNIIDIMIEQVDSGLAAKHRNGQSTFGTMLEKGRTTGVYR